MTTIDPTQIKNNYPNPLDSYRSHSYQFILALASNTQVFRDMIGSNESQAAPLLSAVLQARTPGDKFTVNGQSAYLLVDTRRFSQYAITAVDMEHVYGTGDADNPTVPVSTTHVQLLDTTGFTFFNLLMDLFRNKLETTRSSAFFLLTIFFNGHKDDGTVETVSTCYIPMMLLTMGSKIDHRGAEFEIDFMEIDGGPPRGGAMDIISYMGNVQSISTLGGKPTIGGLISSLEKQLNIQSLGHFQKYSNEALTAAGDSNVKLGKLVQYMLTVPKAWENFPVSLAGRAKNREQMFVATQNANVNREAAVNNFDNVKLQASDQYANMTFSQTVSIPDAIKAILESSLDFLDLASTERRLDGSAQAQRTIPSITCDDATYVVHFDVFPYALPKINTNSTLQNQIVAGTKNVIGSSDLVRNMMTYNYIFTGLNSHILDLKIEYLPESAIAFDTTVEMGQSRFATNAQAGAVRARVDEVSDSSNKRTNSYSPDLRSGDPIFYPYKTQDQQNNIVVQKTESMGRQDAIDAARKRAEYNQTYAYIHFLSSIELDMTIRGNPNLIRKYADRQYRNGIAPHFQIIDAPTIRRIAQGGNAEANFNNLLASSVANAKNRYYTLYVSPRIESVNKKGGNDPLLDGPDVSSYPVFCKMNILTPNVDYTGTPLRNTDPRESLFTDKFFFNGPYMVLYVKSSLTGGTFTQTLSLIPYDISGTVVANDGPSKPNTTTLKN